MKRVKFQYLWSDLIDLSRHSSLQCYVCDHVFPKPHSSLFRPVCSDTLHIYGFITAPVNSMHLPVSFTGVPKGMIYMPSDPHPIWHIVWKEQILNKSLLNS